MCIIKRREFLQGAAALAAGSILAAPRRAHAATELAVVVGASSAVTAISRPELKRLFLGQPVSLSGQSLVPFNAPVGSAERLLFEKVILEMTPEEVTKTWVDLRIRAQAKPPKTAPTIEVLVKLAAAFGGAICYVPVSSVTPAVKVLSLEGKKPGQPAYLLVG